MLNEDISPKIEQLDKDKQNYQKWKTTQNEINRMDKIIKAHNFYTQTKSREIKVNELRQFKSQRMLKDKESLDKKFGDLMNNKKKQISKFFKKK